MQLIIVVVLDVTTKMFQSQRYFYGDAYLIETNEKQRYQTYSKVRSIVSFFKRGVI